MVSARLIFWHITSSIYCRSGTPTYVNVIDRRDGADEFSSLIGQFVLINVVSAAKQITSRY